jgi:hypothetical protein
LVLSKRKPQREPHLSFAAGRCNFRVAVQRLKGAVGVSCGRRDRRARISELRRICEVEHFGPKLQLEALRQAEVAKQAEICVEEAGAADDIPAAGPKTDRGDGSKCIRVEVGIARAMAAENRHSRKDLIRRLKY